MSIPFPEYHPKCFSFFSSHCSGLNSPYLDLIFEITPIMAHLLPFSAASDLLSTFTKEWSSWIFFYCFIFWHKVTAKLKIQCKGLFFPRTICKMRPDAPSATNTLVWYFLQKRVFIHNQKKKSTKITSLTLIYYYHLIWRPNSDSTNYSNKIFVVKICSLESYIVSICHLPLISFDPGTIFESCLDFDDNSLVIK